MTAEMQMPDGTRIRVNDEDAPVLAEEVGWVFLGTIVEDPTPITTHIYDETDSTTYGETY